MIEGFYSLAIEKRVLISFSLSPTYLEIKSADETEKNVPSASVAHALAKNVLPVPGGFDKKFMYPIHKDSFPRSSCSFKQIGKLNWK
jgi:hypothetical protein